MTKPVYVQIDRTQIPNAVRWTVPRSSQGQIVEVAISDNMWMTGQLSNFPRYRMITDQSCHLDDPERLTYWQGYSTAAAARTQPKDFNEARHPGGDFSMTVEARAVSADDDLPPLTTAEFRIAREDLGLSMEQVAARLGVAGRTVRRWEAGQSAVPQGVADQIGGWTDEADRQIALWVARLQDMPEPLLRIPRTGDLDGWPAGWWRMLAARIVEDVPGLRVTYRD